MKTPQKRSTLNAQRSTLNAEGPKNPLRLCISALTTFELRNFRTSCRAFTLFELIAVLTVIGIGLAVLVGSYGSWGTAHALTGATRILEAGLTQARTLAMTQNAYVGFDYGSVETNTFQTVTGFQLFLCTNENAVVADALAALSGSSKTAALDEDVFGIIPAAPYQRLTGHVRLGYIRENDIASPSPTFHNSVTLFFRPDGSVWSWDDTRAHYLCVYTKERFARDTGSEPLSRLLRIDLATGLATLIGGAP